MMAVLMRAAILDGALAVSQDCRPDPVGEKLVGDGHQGEQLVQAEGVLLEHALALGDRAGLAAPVDLDAAGRLPRRGLVLRQDHVVGAGDELRAAVHQVLFGHDLLPDLAGELGRDEEAAVGARALARIGRGRIAQLVHVLAVDAAIVAAHGLGEAAEVLEAMAGRVTHRCRDAALRFAAAVLRLCG
jgi:hypothetical protein